MKKLLAVFIGLGLLTAIAAPSWGQDTTSTTKKKTKTKKKKKSDATKKELF